MTRYFGAQDMQKLRTLFDSSEDYQRQKNASFREAYGGYQVDGVQIILMGSRLLMEIDQSWTRLTFMNHPG